MYEFESTTFPNFTISQLTKLKKKHFRIKKKKHYRTYVMFTKATILNQKLKVSVMPTVLKSMLIICSMS